MRDLHTFPKTIIYSKLKRCGYDYEEVTRPTIGEYHESLHQFVDTVPVSLRFGNMAKEIKYVWFILHALKYCL